MLVLKFRNFAGSELRDDCIVCADDLEGTDGRDRVGVAHRRGSLGVRLITNSFPLFHTFMSSILSFLHKSTIFYIRYLVFKVHGARLPPRRPPLSHQLRARGHQGRRDRRLQGKQCQFPI